MGSGIGHMTVIPLVVVAAASLAGAVAQRVTGLGFALVAAPFLVLAAGPVEGVVLGNSLSLSINLMILVTMVRHVDLETALRAGIPGALIGVPVGAYVVTHLPAPALSITLGTVLVALVVVTARTRHNGVPLPSASGTGIAAAFMTATTGVGGPLFAVYALSKDWPPQRYVATAQACFATFNLTSIATKGPPSWSDSYLPVALAAVAAGIATGQVVASRIPATRLRAAVLAVALVGALGTVIRGVAELVAS